MKVCLRWVAGVACGLLVGNGVAQAATTAEVLPESRAMLQHAISLHTVAGQGQVPVFAAYLADKLKAGGFAAADVEIIPVGETAALVARYRGTGQGKPIVLNGHMDVVAADPKDWQRDPFTLVEENGYFYGRGTADMKASVVELVQTLIRLKHEGFKPSRDLILALSGDEETSMASTRELAKRYRDAEFMLNADGGGGIIDPASGTPSLFELQAAEKTYADFRISFTSPGGHSSEPSPDNAIYRLAQAIARIAQYQFPPQSNEITRASLRALGTRTPGALGAAMQQFAAHPDDAKAAAVISADPAYVGQIRTTCVATTLAAGHALNALPQSASLTVNCRIFPGTSVDSVRDTLAKLVADPKASLVRLPPLRPASPASPLRQDVLDAVSYAVHQRYPKVAVVPSMSAYGTDSMYFRPEGLPSYGVGGHFSKPDDTFAHGLNERLPVSELAAGLDYWHTLLTRLAK